MLTAAVPKVTGSILGRGGLFLVEAKSKNVRAYEIPVQDPQVVKINPNGAFYFYLSHGARLYLFCVLTRRMAYVLVNPGATRATILCHCTIFLCTFVTQYFFVLLCYSR